MIRESFAVEKRRSARLAQELAIHVLGTDVKGTDFLVPTRTLMLSRHGAKILLNHELAPEQEISVYCPGNGKDAEARVVELFTKELDGYCYGIEFLDQEINFWNTTFPPASASTESDGAN